MSASGAGSTSATRPHNDAYTAAPMQRRTPNCTEFSCDEEGYAHFRPSLSPKEIFHLGAFGGTYFRDIAIEKVAYKDAWKEFASPETDWFDGLNVVSRVSSPTYVASRNKYGVKCGQDLDAWLEKGWILPEYDSHGWFHWYCRFFLGRRVADDKRQISRWGKCAGETGRWRRNLIAKCVKAGRPYDDVRVSPVVRQTLLHWAYQLSEKDYKSYERLLKKGAKTSFISEPVQAKKVKDDEDERGAKKKTAQAESRGQRARKRTKH